MNTQQERQFIELYMDGKNDLELAKFFDVGERTVQRWGQKLRMEKKIPSRGEMEVRLPPPPPEKPSTRNIQEIKNTWKVAKPSKKKTKEKGFKSYLVVADQHIPHHNVPCHKAMFKLMEDIPFDGFIILGDYMDMEPISHWLQNKKKTLESKRMKNDYLEGNALLDEYDKRLPKNCDKRFFWGNHEEWYNGLIEGMPALEGYLNPTTDLNLEERGYKVYEDLNHIQKIGKLHYTHGIYCTVNSVKKHIDELKTNVIFGHTHGLGARSEKSPARDTAMIGYNVPCLCNKSPKYMKNRPDKWVQGFGIVHYLDNGDFWVDLIRIVRDRFVYNNKLYEGR